MRLFDVWCMFPGASRYERSIRLYAPPVCISRNIKDLTTIPDVCNGVENVSIGGFLRNMCTVTAGEGAYGAGEGIEALYNGSWCFCLSLEYGQGFFLAYTLLIKTD